MIVEAIEASIHCTDCKYEFTYSVSLANCKLEKAYDEFFKRNLGSCPHCKTGTLSIVHSKYKIKPTKHRYIAHWRCNICNQVWHQVEYLESENPLMGSLLKRFTNDTKTRCPACGADNKKLVDMSQ